MYHPWALDFLFPSNNLNREEHYKDAKRFKNYFIAESGYEVPIGKMTTIT